ncbi:MAG: RecX family transcriptional regulator [Gluconacetobacter diazotrophicus]|nr:RecX family transcriptional regulator [Gluconacetobacter diazotrophicus]
MSSPAAARSRRPPDLPPGPAPAAADLRDAALRHLARFSATEAGLLRVLDRRIDRWSRRSEHAGAEPDAVAAAAAAAREAARAVSATLVRERILDDAAFAAGRARSLNRSGRSRRAIGAHLMQQGVGAELAQEALPERGAEADAAELAAAVMQARRRRVGPFAPPDLPDDESGERRHRALAALARAGFGRDVAERALDLDPEAAEDMVNALRRS